MSAAHQRDIDDLLSATYANDGLAPVDLEQFWQDQALAIADPFGMAIPQVALGIGMGDECVFDELGVPEDYWRYQVADPEWRLALNKEYNEKALRIVGRRMLSESVTNPAFCYPPIGGLHDVFEAKNIWEGASWWLQQSAHTEDELAALLDRVDSREIRRCILPENWEEEKARLLSLGVMPPLYRHQRGPVTFATSIFGVENLIFLLHDNPSLTLRFSETILRVMLEIARILDEESGYSPETAPHGFSFADDNCCLLTPEMYEMFAYPILEGMFARYSPNAGDGRFQHSDSAMGHLLSLLGRLCLTGVNFGPTLTVSEIRAHLPHAIIYGQLAPFTFSRNEEAKIVAECLRDFDMASEQRGLVFSTAGSVNNGSRLTGLRLIMAAIQRYGRYS